MSLPDKAITNPPRRCVLWQSRFGQPILNSPDEVPTRYRALDQEGRLLEQRPLKGETPSSIGVTCTKLHLRAEASQHSLHRISARLWPPALSHPADLRLLKLDVACVQCLGFLRSSRFGEVPTDLLRQTLGKLGN